MKKTLLSIVVIAIFTITSVNAQSDTENQFYESKDFKEGDIKTKKYKTSKGAFYSYGAYTSELEKTYSPAKIDSLYKTVLV